MKASCELELSEASRMAQAARMAARAQGLAISVAVCDAAGRAVLFERDDGASGISVDLAPAKARTAALLGLPSGRIEQAIDRGHPALLALTGCVPLAGGVEIRIGERVVGAIAVSGAPSGEQDEVLARAGLEALGKASAQ